MQSCVWNMGCPSGTKTTHEIYLFPTLLLPQAPRLDSLDFMLDRTRRRNRGILRKQYCWRRTQTLTTQFLFTGSIRRHRDRERQVGPRPRFLPAHLFQEHPGDRPGHQRLEAEPRPQVPRERPGAQGGRAFPQIRWQHRSLRPRYATIRTERKGEKNKRIKTAHWQWPSSSSSSSLEC